MATVTQDRLVEVEAVEVPVAVRAAGGAEKTFWPCDQGQVLLMAPSILDWVPDGHLARFVSDLVDEALDLGAIYAASEEQRGFPPYDPRLMVKLLIYGYATGTPSSRKLEERTYSDVAARFLCADQHPDFRPIARFRKRHLEALADLFVQALRLCRRAGLVGLGTLALDGTKLRANASRHKAMSYERMVAKEAQLEGEIAAIRANAKGLSPMPSRSTPTRISASAPTGAVTSCPTTSSAARTGWRGSGKPSRRLTTRPRGRDGPARGDGRGGQDAAPAGSVRGSYSMSTRAVRLGC